MRYNAENSNNNVLSNKIKTCLKCGAKTDSKDEKEYFCSQCGAPVLNKCSNYECNEILNGEAKYCKHCGSPSIFLNYGLFDSTPKSIEDDNLPF